MNQTPCSNRSLKNSVPDFLFLTGKTHCWLQPKNSMKQSYLLLFFLQSCLSRGKFLLPSTQTSFQSLCLPFPFGFLVSHHDVNLLHQLLQLGLTGCQEATTSGERAWSHKGGPTQHVPCPKPTKAVEHTNWHQGTNSAHAVLWTLFKSARTEIESLRSEKISKIINSELLLNTIQAC